MAKQRQEERRNQILWAAMTCVAEAGIEGATLKAIARRAGVSTGTIAYYFRDKNDVMEQALAFGHHLLGERMSLLTGPAPGLSRIEAVFQVNIVEKYPDVPPLSFWLEYWAHSSRDGELRSFREGRMARFRRNLAASVQAAIDAGDLREDLDPLFVADLLAALEDGLQLKVAIDSSNVSPERAMQVYRRLIDLLRPPSESLALREKAAALA
ncbi:MAG TPA: TetR family transcriptional regulator C-terminal domain-containing protein [Dehalococcoidia bacterium]